MCAFPALVAKTNHPGDKDGEAGFHVQNRRVFMMDGALTNCQLACGQAAAAGCGRWTCCPEMRVQLPHKLWLYCWIPPTLNGNVSPGQSSMVLRMGLQPARGCVWASNSSSGLQLCPRHTPAGHFTQSNWISCTVDPVTFAVTRHWANQQGHGASLSSGPHIKKEFVQLCTSRFMQTLSRNTQDAERSRTHAALSAISLSSWWVYKLHSSLGYYQCFPISYRQLINSRWVLYTLYDKLISWHFFLL